MDEQLTFYGSLASIISLVIAFISLAYIRSVRVNIIQFRRRKRVMALIEEIKRLPRDAVPFTNATKAKIESLKHSIDLGIILWRFTKKGIAKKRLYDCLEIEDLDSIVEAIEDWTSYSEDL